MIVGGCGQCGWPLGRAPRSKPFPPAGAANAPDRVAVKLKAFGPRVTTRLVSPEGCAANRGWLIVKRLQCFGLSLLPFAATLLSVLAVVG